MAELQKKRITVFGGSRCTADTDEYREALTLGRLIVESGFEVCSGGYAGVMEAISRGASEAGGHVIGMTMTQFNSSPNPYVKTIEPSESFYARLQKLIVESAAYVAFRGGMGTMTEISLVWNKLTMNVLERRPLILLGDCWPRAFECLREHLVISERDMTFLTFAATAEEAIEVLTTQIR